MIAEPRDSTANERTGARDGRTTALPQRTRRGVVLLFVLAYMFLVGALMVTMAGGLAQFSDTARQARTSILLRQLTDSALDWAEQHDEVWMRETEITLDAAGLLPPDASATVRLQSQPGSGTRTSTILIEARLEMRSRSYTRTVSVSAER